MPKINQLNSTARLSNTDLLAVETPAGENTRSIAYGYLLTQIQNESKSVFALHGEIASDVQVAEATSSWLATHIHETAGTTTIDDTLTISGAAADARATGNLIVINGTSGSSTKVNITTSDVDIKLAEMRDVDNLAVHNACNYIPNALNAQHEQNGITWTDLGNGVMSYSGEMIDPTLGSQTRYYYSTALLPDWAEYGKKYYVKVESDNPKLCLSPIFYNSDGGTISTLYFYSDGTFEIPSDTAGMQIRVLMTANATVSGIEYIRTAILNTDSNISLTEKVEDLLDKTPRLYEYNAYNFIGSALLKTATNQAGTFTWTDLGNGHASFIGDSPNATQFLYYNDKLHLPDWAERDKTYFIKVKTTSQRIRFNLQSYDSTGSVISGSSSYYYEDGTYTIPSNAVGMQIRLYCVASTTISETGYIQFAILGVDSNASLTENVTRSLTRIANLETEVGQEITELDSRVDALCYLESTGTDVDRTADIYAMLDSTGKCYLGPGVFIVSGIDLPAYSSLIGSGTRTVVRLAANIANGYAIKLSSYCSVSNMRISGGTTAPVLSSTVGTRHGILFEGTRVYNQGGATLTRCSVTNCGIVNFTGGGITMNKTGTPYTSNMLISNCFIDHCGAGINIPYYSEFHRICNCSITDCWYGIVDNGGNNNFANCDISGNKIGILIDNSNDQSVNNSHGTFSSCSVNHSFSTSGVMNEGIAIQILGALYGEVFTGMQIFYGAVIVQNSTGIRFIGANIGGNVPITITGSKVVTFSDCTFKEGPNTTASPFTQSGNTALKFTDCYLRTGTVYNPV